jgi:cobalt/nickel transport system permease protein
VLGAGLGGLLRLELFEKLPGGGSRVWIATGLASWVSVMLAALACGLELALAGVLPLTQVVPAMLGVHTPIGVGEALVTCAALALFDWPATAGAASTSRSFAAPALAALLIALCLSPFASPLPDGLEAVMAHYQVLHEAAPLFVTPLADYQVAGIASEALSTGLAGSIGVVLTFLIAGMLALPLTRARAA